jgi:hypothetical protein
LRLAPAASSRLIAEAARWLESWSQTPLHSELRDALRGRTPIERGVRWALEWTEPGRPPCCIHGIFDLIYRDRAGRWRPVILGIRPGDEAADLLRLALAQAAATRLGKSPLGPSWWVHPGTDGVLAAEARLTTNAASISAAFSRWVNEH